MLTEKSDSRTRLLVTGASGFVGGHLQTRLELDKRHDCSYMYRSSSRIAAGVAHVVVDQGLGPSTDWSQALDGVRYVIHAAGRAHVMGESQAEALVQFRVVNTMGAACLARQAAAAGVRRFIYLSSVKVHGELSRQGQPLIESSELAPLDPYGISKYEAEIELQNIATQTNMEVVIIRPPLVYGPGVGANFLALSKAVASGIPLPLGSIRNRRSLIGVDNLVDFILLTLEHPDAANQTFLISDGDDLSTPELIRQIASAMGKPARLLPLPIGALQFGATVLGRRLMAQRLCGNLQVDMSKARSLLGWSPPITVQEGLRRTFTAHPTSSHEAPI